MKPNCIIILASYIDNKRTVRSSICKLVKTREVIEVCALKLEIWAMKTDILLQDMKSHMKRIMYFYGNR